MSRFALVEGTISADNLYDLSQIDDNYFSNGAIASVVSLLDVFCLDKNSNLSSDGITIINTKSGIGKWIRLIVNNVQWSRQKNWYIDSVTGNDENNGNISQPIKTIKEWYRRVGRNIIQVKMTLYVLGNLLQNDNLTEEINIDFGTGSLNITGELGLNVLYSGTIDGYVPCEPFLNTPWEITDSSMPNDGYWSNYINFNNNSLGQRIKITSGLNINNIFWAARDRYQDGYAKTCRISQPMPYNQDYNSQSLGAVNIGDDFNIEQIPKIYGFAPSINVIGSNPLAGETLNSSFPYFSIKDLSLNNPIYGFSSYMKIYGIDNPAASIFYNCDIRQIINGRCLFLNCKLVKLEQANSDNMWFFGGLFLGSEEAKSIGLYNFWFDFRFLIQDAFVESIGGQSSSFSKVKGYPLFSSIQIFNFEPSYVADMTRGISVRNNSAAYFLPGNGEMEIFGRSQNLGIILYASAMAFYDSTNILNFSLTGNLSDIRMGMIDTNYNPINSDIYYSYDNLPITQVTVDKVHGIKKIVSITSFQPHVYYAHNNL